MNPNNNNVELTSYESCLNCIGEVAGFIKAWLPCFCICCSVNSPFYRVNQSQVGLVEKFGKYFRSLEPGLNKINPCTDSVISVDLKTLVIDLQQQTIITKDNVTIKIDTVMYYRIVDPYKATYKVQSLTSSAQELTYAALRLVCGEHTLQELLEHREKVQDSIEAYMDKHTADWGIFVEEVFIKDMILTSQMQSELSAAAKNKRIAQAKIISAKADVESAKLMRDAADYLDNKAAMQVRYLETLQLMSRGGNKKIIFLPLSADNNIGTQ